MKLKANCCRKFERKGKGCSRCPTLAGLGKKARKKLLKK